MAFNKHTKVLIVDDSILFREVLSRGISSDPDIEVVAKAKDAFDARDKIIQFRPDVMICDVQMPRMNGIEFIRRLMPQYPLPIIVVSTISDAVFDAMDAGALDFVGKPDIQSVGEVESFIKEIIDRIKTISNAKVVRPGHKNIVGKVAIKSEINKDKIIAIGASTGGTNAIYGILKALPSKIPGIVIVQHIPPIFSRMFAERLNLSTGLNVEEAKTGNYVEGGKVLIAPGDQHMKIRKIGSRYKVQCFKGEKVNGHCPSVDVLFESVAKEAGENSIGVILTGMGYDGAKGLQMIKRKGGRTIGQDEKSSVVYGMPKVAFDIGAVEQQASVGEIADIICSLVM